MAGLDGRLPRCLVLSRLAAAAMSVPLVMMTAPLAVADDDPISVSPDAAGWVDAVVVDAGTAAVAPKKTGTGPAPKRTCTQAKSENAGGYATQQQFDSGAPPGDGPGGWVTRTCSDGTIGIAWVAVAPLVASPEQLAQRARNRLRLPLPQPRFDPSRPSSAGPSTLVNLPTWFFLDKWKPVRQRTQAGGVWAEVTATPVEATWFPGDGNAPVRCLGAGRAWTSDTETAGACRYTYVRSSAAQPGLVYPARVVVVWQVTWRGSGGRGGSLPLMERQVEFPIAVAERQTVVVVGGGE